MMGHEYSGSPISSFQSHHSSVLSVSNQDIKHGLGSRAGKSD